MPSCDHTGIPHFHSSTTFGSASLMSLRILASVSPRQPASSAMRSSISTEGGWPPVEPDFFMVLRSQMTGFGRCRPPAVVPAVGVADRRGHQLLGRGVVERGKLDGDEVSADLLDIAAAEGADA